MIPTSKSTSGIRPHLANVAETEHFGRWRQKQVRRLSTVGNPDIKAAAKDLTLARILEAMGRFQKECFPEWVTLKALGEEKAIQISGHARCKRKRRIDVMLSADETEWNPNLPGFVATTAQKSGHNYWTSMKLDRRVRNIF